MELHLGGECNPHTITSIINIFNKPDVRKLSTHMFSEGKEGVTTGVYGFLGFQELQIQFVMSHNEEQQKHSGNRH